MSINKYIVKKVPVFVMLDLARQNTEVCNGLNDIYLVSC